MPLRFQFLPTESTHSIHFNLATGCGTPLSFKCYWKDSIEELLGKMIMFQWNAGLHIKLRKNGCECHLNFRIIPAILTQYKNNLIGSYLLIMLVNEILCFGLGADDLSWFRFSALKNCNEATASASNWYLLYSMSQAPCSIYKHTVGGLKVGAEN